MFAWLPSAIVENDKSNIIYIYPILCIDVDGKDNIGVDMSIVKEQLFSLPFVYYVGTSIGGNGVFALTLIDDPLYFKEQFYAMEEYLLNNFNIKVDSQCCNANRLRYCSYDEEPLVKDEDTEIIAFTEVKFKSVVKKNTDILSLFKPTTKDLPDLLSDDNFCYAVIDFCINKLFYQSGNRTGGWLQDLSACKSLGISGEDLALRLSRQSSSYISDADVIKTLNHKSTYARRENIVKFFKLCKEHFNKEHKNWIYSIKEMYNL
jgi:hypothetical protein